MSAIGNPRLAPVQAPQTPAPAGAPPPESRPSHRGRYVVVALLLLGGLLAWQFALKPDPAATNAPVASIKTATVTSGPIQKTVRVTGQTSSREFANITAPISRGFESGREMILLFLVPSGTRVKKGDMLAQIDMKAVEDHIDDVKDDVEKAEADIGKRKAEQSIDSENLEQTIRVAKATFEKAKLDQRAGETRTSVDQELLKLAVEEAEAAYQQALARCTAQEDFAGSRRQDSRHYQASPRKSPRAALLRRRALLHALEHGRAGRSAADLPQRRAELDPAGRPGVPRTSCS